MCVRGCVCVCGLDRTGKAALSAQAVICALKDTFSPVFTQEDSRQNRFSLPQHGDVHSNVPGGGQTRAHTYSCARCSPAALGIIRNCVKNKLKTSGECPPPPSKDGKMQHGAGKGVRVRVRVREGEARVASNRLRVVRCAE